MTYREPEEPLFHDCCNPSGWGHCNNPGVYEEGCGVWLCEQCAEECFGPVEPEPRWWGVLDSVLEWLAGFSRRKR